MGWFTLGWVKGEVVFLQPWISYQLGHTLLIIRFNLITLITIQVYELSYKKKYFLYSYPYLKMYSITRITQWQWQQNIISKYNTIIIIILDFIPGISIIISIISPHIIIISGLHRSITSASSLYLYDLTSST